MSREPHDAPILTLPHPSKVLILGGTEEARHLAELLTQRGHDVTTSQKGATKKRLSLSGHLRIGGFSSVSTSSEQGLRDYVQTGQFDVVVDATHPFAANISPRAANICAALALPYLRLERPPWTPGPQDNWHFVESLDEALKALPLGARCFAAIGRQQIKMLAARDDCLFFARAIEATSNCPQNVTQIIDRPPFALDDELALFKTHQITHLIAKNAGGAQTEAKLAAARELSINLIIVNRPKNQPKQHFTDVFDIVKTHF